MDAERRERAHAFVHERHPTWKHDPEWCASMVDDLAAFAASEAERRESLIAAAVKSIAWGDEVLLDGTSVGVVPTTWLREAADRRERDITQALCWHLTQARDCCRSCFNEAVYAATNDPDEIENVVASYQRELREKEKAGA